MTIRRGRSWRIRTLACTALAAALGTGTLTAGPAEAAPADLRITRFLGEQRVPFKQQFMGTTVGGFSGIDRDPATDTWYLVSDDRWRYNPARFYTGKLDINRGTGAFTGFRLTGVNTFLRSDGTPYPGFGLADTVDPETIRFDRHRGRLLWGQEGDRSDETHPGIPLSNLSLRWIDREGRHLGEVPLPANLNLTQTTSGPRRNYGIEALTFTPHSIVAAVETSRYEDGPQPTVDHGAPARITVWDRAGRRAHAQYAYPIDRLTSAPNPPTGIADSGVSEILAVDDHRFLAMERTWLEGVSKNYVVKLYEFDLRGATNILARNSLTDGRPYRPVAKRLVADLTTFRAPSQNLESLGWGPRLATGECSLVIGSDDNFSGEEVTQLLAFAVRGC